MARGVSCRPRRALKQLALAAVAAILAFVASAVVAPQQAPALPQDALFCPGDFPAGGHFVASGTVIFNTDTSPNMVVVNGYAVFTFDSITVPAGSTIVGTGSRPMVLLSKSFVSIEGSIDASTSSSAVGPGGHSSGSGPGKPLQAPIPPGGSAGGSFGGLGGNGSAPNTGGSGGIRGPTYGNLATNLEGGSGGGATTGSPSNPGGGGGGALFIGATTSVTIAPGGAISANGGHGAASTQGGSGGGSGGAIALYATTVTNDGVVAANGGFGGDGSPSTGAGGGGGGGRIIVGLTAGGISNGSGTYRVLGGLGGLGAFGTPGGGVGAPGVVSSTSYACSGPTAVTLRSLRATRTPGGVLLRWRTAGAGGVLGFDVYRGERRLNRKLIAAANRRFTRAYSFLDVRGTTGSRYWLELVRADGSRSRVGPVRA